MTSVVDRVRASLGRPRRTVVERVQDFLAPPSAAPGFSPARPSSSPAGRRRHPTAHEVRR